VFNPTPTHVTRKVLTVDDSKVVRMMVKRALQTLDCLIVEASNGREGLQQAELEKPDLILLDVTMPEMTGLEMLTQLRMNEKTKSIPVIMLTAESGQTNIAHADRLGISGYFSKPFKEEHLRAKVQHVVPIHERRS
jgi:two-component system, cell cycle response regulator